MIIRSRPVNKEEFIQKKCREKVVLDVGCIRHVAEFSIKDPNWLHKRVKLVAQKVIGVDYLSEEVEKLKKIGYDIITADITKEIKIDEKFDVIVCGDLIEHLVNFEGFFENCKKLLKSDGIIIITTPNPFYAGEFHYAAFKKNFLINPEHTCWIDPQALAQLSSRFGFGIKEIYFIKKSWRLGELVCESKNHRYDIFQGKWFPDSFGFRLFRVLVAKLFDIFYWPYKLISGSDTALVRYSDYLAVLSKI